ncbi:MAG: response regulator [Scytonematopsis contorta HA4267-MV1]|jgi:signal transduction histidine kinase/DNA-binding NarL/FixJ family response regulator|nr:response regulator [Scytonematopsis contorta HA4267-MV1]
MPNAWKLLIIDDCAADRKIYRRYLLNDPHQSYQILEIDSGEEALALCLEIHFDAILLDFCLPDMSGLEFLDRMIKQKLGLITAVIMLTGRGDEEIAVQAMKKGVQDYLVKQHLKADVLQLTTRNAVKHCFLQRQLNKTLERQRLIATTALSIRQSLDLQQILHRAVVEVQQLLKCDRVVVYQSIPSIGVEIVASSNQLITSEAKTSCNINRYGCQSEIELVDEIQLCCRLNPPEPSKNQANLLAPITLSNNGNQANKHWGWLIAHQCSAEPKWQSDDLEILNQMSVQLAIAIQQAELLQQTQAALEKEQQLNAFKSRIIATISHEYRTPLASILGAASTLKQHGNKLDEFKQQRFLGMIQSKTRHLSKLIDDMLSVNQFELGKTKFQPIPLDLLEFFSDLMEEQRETASENHELILKITGNNKGFCGDKGLLRLIFTNLMSNAIKYSPNGGDVEFHLMGKDSQVIFCIQDKGIGIPKIDQENLFQPFNRGSNVDTIPGTGLGLVIAKSCVELHGGYISLESQPGQGTKVSVNLPKYSLLEEDNNN